MDIIASAASIAQLLGQLISLGQQIHEARECMRGLPKLLADQNTQLQDLLETIRLIQAEEVLQVPEVGELLLRVHGIARELHAALEIIATEQKKNPARQFLHVLGSGDQMDKQLKVIHKRLDQVKMSLSLRIQITHVAVSATTREEFIAFSPVIQRIEAHVQSLCSDHEQENIGTCSRSAGDAFSFENETNASTSQEGNSLSIDSNSASDGSNQFNTICGMERLQRTVTAVIYDNVAIGKSTQRNIIMDAESFEKFWMRQES